MALTGTLQDFGIADIIQLIAQQRKTGILNVKDRDREVEVHFHEGRVVGANLAGGKKHRDLLGIMMVRAEIITPSRLDQALAVKKRTLKRLAKVLVEERIVKRYTVKQMQQLQITETVYKLFRWQKGTYAFRQDEVDYDPELVEPMDSENLLMEGFRIMDEWPMVRKQIPSRKLTFYRAKPLKASPGADSGDELDKTEKKIYALAHEGVSVQRIVDLSRIGEFETYKALGSLQEKGYLKTRMATRVMVSPGEWPWEGMAGSLREMLTQFVVGVLVLAAVSVLLFTALGVERIDKNIIASRGVMEAVSLQARLRIDRAIDVYRLENGEFPKSLEDLVDVELLSEKELKYPWSAKWYYRVLDDEPGEYLLLPPVQ